MEIPGRRLGKTGGRGWSGAFKSFGSLARLEALLMLGGLAEMSGNVEILAGLPSFLSGGRTRKCPC